METIGQRAVKAIRQRAKENGVAELDEFALLGIEPRIKRGWEKEGINPSAKFLQNMAREGYDIMWILLGDEK